MLIMPYMDNSSLRSLESALIYYVFVFTLEKWKLATYGYLTSTRLYSASVKIVGQLENGNSYKIGLTDFIL